MHNLIRNIVSIFIVVVLMCSISGLYIKFRVEQYNIKSEVKEKVKSNIPESELTQIEISQNNFDQIEWIENGKEFRYYGKMYDVVKVKTQGQNKVYYCINDIKEKQLIARFNKNNKDQKNTKKIINQTLNDKYFPKKCQSLNSINPTVIVYAGYFLNYKSEIIRIPSPPPRPVVAS